MKKRALMVLFGAALMLGTMNVGAEETKVLRAGATTGFFGAESLDPGYNWDGWIMSIYGISENLFRLDASFTPQPHLAESYENVDEKTWKFTLRDDVTFSNGTKMTADSVKKCFERTYAQNARAQETLAIESMDADGQVLTIVTAQPNPTMINDLCDPLFGVYDAEGTIDEVLGASCTGPFVATAFDPMVSVSMVKNENYWGGEPKVDHVELTIIDDQSALTMALQNGEINLIAQLPAAEAELFDDADTCTVDAMTSTRANFLAYNLEKEGVSDPAVRTAIGFCIDRESFADVVYSGFASPSYGVYPASMSYGGSDDYELKIDAYDPEKAAQILAEAGYEDTDGNGILDKDGQDLTMTAVTYSYNTECLQLADMLQSELSNIGIGLEIETYDVIDETMESGAYDIGILNYAMAPIGTPGYFANMCFRSDASNNYGHYKNDKVDELIDSLNQTFDDAEKIDLAKQINQEILNDGAYDFVIHQQLICVYSNHVKGFEINPTEYYLITNQIDIE